MLLLPRLPRSLRRCVPLAAGLCALFALGCGRPSVLLVGLDGADWDVIDILVEAEALPTLARLVERGARADLDCTPAMPETACFCPPVWTSIATGQPEAVHGLRTVAQGPDDRRVPALWNVLAADGGRTTSLAMRNGWPPEPDVTYALTEAGADWASRRMFARWPGRVDEREQDAARRARPPDLLERLGLLPHAGERPPVWENVARDRVSMRTLLRLARVDRTDLTVLLLHSPDKVEHVTWGAVQDAPGEPLHRDVLERQVDGWTGPVTGPAPWSFGNVASPYLEIDAFLGVLLARAHYDYVVLVSDHGMTRNLGPGLAGLHGPAFPEAHRGILLLHGRDVRRGASLGTVSVLDVAPTLAYMLDLPIARDLPGRFLEEAFLRGARRRAWEVESWSEPLPERRPGGNPPWRGRGPWRGLPDREL